MGSASVSDSTDSAKDSGPYFGTVPSAPLPERIAKKPIAHPKSADARSTSSSGAAAHIDPIVTYALPPTVTTTHYTETPNGELQHGQPVVAAINMNTSSPNTIPTNGCNSNHGNSNSSCNYGNGGRRKSSVASMKSGIGISLMGAMNTSRRPSAETMMSIPHAALSAHRHSLQLAGDDVGPIAAGGSAAGGSIGGLSAALKIGRSGSEKGCPRLNNRTAKTTPERIRKALFGSSSKEPR